MASGRAVDERPEEDSPFRGDDTRLRLRSPAEVGDRPTSVCGRFYPRDPVALSKRVHELLPAPVTAAHAHAIMAPHGSLDITGPVAGAAYGAATVPSVAILLGSCHWRPTPRTALQSTGRWCFPGGAVDIDTRLAEELRMSALLSEDGEAHCGEHSLEMQLPFLVRCNPHVRIVPILLGDLTPGGCARIAEALAATISRNGRDALVVASAHLHHYSTRPECERRNAPLLEAIESLDSVSYLRASQDPRVNLCGQSAVAVAMEAARLMGASRGHILALGHTARTSQDLGLSYSATVFR